MNVAAIVSLTGGIRRPGVRQLVVLVVAAVLLLASAALAVPAGAAGAAVPTGVWPLSPTPAVVRGFDPPSSPYGAGHRGVDLAGAVGAPVRAALGGTVTFAGSLAGRGVVVVDHGETRTTYEPVDPSVAVGDVVTPGAVIGTLALTQSHCLPMACLHWGWIRNADDVYLDPLDLVGLDQPVRLLPLWQSSPVARAPVAASWAPPLPYAGWRPPISMLLP